VTVSTSSLAAAALNFVRYLATPLRFFTRQWLTPGFYQNSTGHLLASAVRAGFAVLLTVVLTRRLGPVAFGHYGVAVAFVLLIGGSLNDIGLATVLIRHLSDDASRKRHESLVTSAIAVQAAISVVVFCFALAALPLLAYGADTTVAIAVYALGLLIFPLSLLTAPFQANLRIARLIPAVIVGNATGFILALTFALTTSNVALILGATVVGLLIHHLLVAWRWYRENRPIRSRPSLWTGWQLVLEALPIGLSTALRVTWLTIPVLILGFLSMRQAGFYAAASKFPAQALAIPLAVDASAFPALSALWAGSNRAEFARLLNRLLVITLGLGTAVIAVAMPLRDSILVALFGEAFQPATAAFAILIVVSICQTCTAFLGSGVNAAAKARVNFWLGVLVTPVFILGAYVGAIAWGAAGVATALLGGDLLLLVLLLIYVWRRLRIPIRVWYLCSGGLMLGLTAAGAWLFGSQHPAIVAVCGLGVAAAYVAAARRGGFVPPLALASEQSGGD
jgi:O-antigen/teichoic acid export membrane protein